MLSSRPTRRSGNWLRCRLGIPSRRYAGCRAIELSRAKGPAGMCHSASPWPSSFLFLLSFNRQGSWEDPPEQKRKYEYSDKAPAQEFRSGLEDREDIVGCLVDHDLAGLRGQGKGVEGTHFIEPRRNHAARRGTDRRCQGAARYQGSSQCTAGRAGGHSALTFEGATTTHE